MFWAEIWKYYCHICVRIIIHKFGTKNTLFAYFWVAILRNYCHIWNQRSGICLIAKFRVRTKMPKTTFKNALFGCFWARTLKHYCHILNQRPLICLTAKFRTKRKILKLGNNNASDFEGSFEKLLLYLKSELSNLSNCKIFLRE